MKTLFENTVVITERMNTESQKIERSIRINGNLVYEEKTTAIIDRRSTSNPKLFIDWLIGYENKNEVKKNNWFQKFISKFKCWLF